MKLSMDVQHYHEYEYANADIIMSMIFFSSQLSCVFMMNRVYSSYALENPSPRFFEARVG